MAQNGALVEATPPPKNKADGATLTGKQEHCMYSAVRPRQASLGGVLLLLNSR